MSIRTRPLSVLSLATLAAATLAAAACSIPDMAPAAPQKTGAAVQDSVAFTRFLVPDGDQPNIEAGVWRAVGPVAAPRPLIVISHGTGGYFRSHLATAEGLARAGFVVVALTHTGDNWRDQSRATDLGGRTRQVSVLIDYMLTAWEGRGGIDAKQIGAFGYSAGGFTMLAAAGGEPDMTRMVEHCRSHPDYFDCRLVAKTPSTGSPAARDALVIHRDPRLKALVIAAPALGFTFAGKGLAGVTQPVQLWQAGADQILPAPSYVEPVRAALPKPPEFFRVEGAGHYDFMPPWSVQLKLFAPAICAPTPGFDRADFHETFDREVIRFFTTHLRVPSPRSAASEASVPGQSAR
ncbi:dienelactone hydrolase family protein, partial [Phenylobacterium sp.]|uniref:alpha/beta hydrolase family protein n=1 Tax=Phenylobacterium sp. TaxID=1871053 RepID=UPI0025D0D199